MRRRVLRAILLFIALSVVPMAGFAWLFSVAELPPLPVPRVDPLVLRDVNLINPGGRHLIGVTLRASGGRITEISDGPPAPSSTPRYVLPGLTDAHVHSPFLPGDHRLWATLFLLHGVTSVRNLGDSYQPLSRKVAVQSGHEAGPRIFACGIPLDGEAGGFPARVLRNAKEARREVENLVAAGADCIKIMPHLSAESYAALREAGRAHDLPIVGHVVNVFGDRGIEESGIADVQHLTGVPAVPSPGLAAAEWHRFHAAWDQLPPERVEHIVSVSKRLGVIHTPTLVGGAYEVPGAAPSRLELLPAWYKTAWTAFDRARSDDERALSARNLPRYLEVVRKLHRAGVLIQAGSDVFPFVPYIVPGASLHDELRLLTQAGLSPEAALAAATTVPGAFLNRRMPGLGRIEVGAPADLLIFGEDPTARLASLDSLQTVVAAGRRYDITDLRQHLRVQLEASRRFPYAWAARVLGWLMSLFA